MRSRLLRALSNVAAFVEAGHACGISHRERTRVYVNRAERRARVDDEEIVPPELARRPPLTDGDG